MKRLSKKQIFGMIILALILGIVCGYTIVMNCANPAEFGTYINQTYSSNGLSKKTMFLRALLTYGKYVIFIWFMVFINFGVLWSLLTVFLKGISIGITGGLILALDGGNQINKLFKFMGLQTLIFVPVIIFMTYGCIYYSMNKTFKTNKKIAGNSVLEYGIILLVGVAGVVLVSLVEGYIVSGFNFL